MSSGTTFVMMSLVAKYQILSNISLNFCASSHRFRYIFVSNFYLWKVDQSHGMQLAVWGHSIANIKFYKSRQMHFCVSTNHFRDINASNLFSSKNMSRLWRTIFTMRLFNCKYQNLQRCFTHSLALAVTISVLLTFQFIYLQKVGQDLFS